MKALLNSPANRLAAAVALLSGTKLVVGVALLSVSARWLGVREFAAFAQLSVLSAFLVLISTAGVQQGLIRQVAAAQNPADVRRILQGGLVIWAAVSAATLTLTLLASGRISTALLGDDRIAYAIPPLALLAAVSGLGQLLCSVLTGQGRALLSILLQGLGLLVSAFSIGFLLRGDGVAAALAFAGGTVVTTILGLAFIVPLLARWSGPLRQSLGEARRLLRFSAAFLVTAAIMPLTLIALRAVYQATFGIENLGFWLAANRISDVNTQFIGLYMIQVFLPAMTRSSQADELGVVRRAFWQTSGLVLVGLIVFAIRPQFFVSLFLTPRFLPAIPSILIYMLGDVLRVSASIATFTALARNRLRLYITFEAVAAVLLSILVLGLIRLHVVQAGPIGYALTYGAVALIALAVFWSHQRRGLAARA